jgi:very-short-patch-repair endonuclease
MHDFLELELEGDFPELAEDFAGDEDLEKDAWSRPWQPAYDILWAYCSCESPIEVALAIQLRRLLRPPIELVSQYKVGGFRFDFAIYDREAPRLWLLVECDGRLFHSTPQQLANDRKKDAYAKSIGVPLLRFSGSAIHRDPQDCADLVLEALV